MRRPRRISVALLLTLLLSVAGCHPTQPFFMHEDGDLSHYLSQATTFEQADVDQISLEEVRQARPPLTLTNPRFGNFWDLELEEAISIALNNSQVVRTLSSLTQFTISDGLVGRTALSATVYDPAIFETDPQFGIAAALSDFDAQFTSQVFWQKTDRPQNVDTSAIGFIPFIFNQDLGQFDAELSKRTASGVTYTFRNQTIYDQNNRGFGRALPSDWFTGFEAEASIPILQNRGAQVNRVPVMLARIRTDLSLFDFEASVRNMIMDIENAYWDLHFAYRSLQTAKIGRDSAQVAWTIAQAKRQQGAGDAREEAQAREQYYAFRAQTETSLRDVFNFETRLRWLMGLTPTDDRLIRPVTEPTIAKVTFEWAEVHAEAQFRTPELNRQKWVIKQREQELIAARNLLLPQLDFVANYRWLGLGDDLIRAKRRGLNFAQRGSMAFDELTEGRYQEARLALQFTPPAIGARRELAGIQNAKLALVREKARFEDMELNVSHVLTTSMQNLVYNYEVARTQFNRWVAAEEEVEVAELLFRGGKETIDNLMDAQRRRAIAQADFYRAIIDYNKSIADVHFRKGSLLDYNNVQLAEGPWPKKAYWDAMEQARQRDASYYWQYGSTRPKVMSRGPMGEVPPLPAGNAEELPQPQTEGTLEGPLAGVPGMAAPMESVLGDETDLPATLKEFQWGELGLAEPPMPTPVRQASHATPR